jgi:hypothetical protein
MMQRPYGALQTQDLAREPKIPHLRCTKRVLHRVRDDGYVPVPGKKYRDDKISVLRYEFKGSQRNDRQALT